MKSGFTKVSDAIDGYREEMVATLSEMVSIKAISPGSGGKGEGARAEFLEGLLRRWGFDVKRYSYRDESGVERPSLVARLGGGKVIWIVAHIDTVAEGDLSLWKSDPYKARVEEGRVYGRGTNDDGQAVISSMYALRVLKETGSAQGYCFGLVLAADEEVGSRYGMQMLMKEGIFGSDDMFVVPDHGAPDGSSIEVGEKGMLWVKITVIGKQAHASTPANGANAFRYMIRLLGLVDERLHRKYTARDGLFSPDYSTFEMTKHEKNVDSINIIPGREIAYVDCRVLPRYKLDDVLADMKEVAAMEEFKPVGVEIEVVNREDPAPITPSDSELVRLLGAALKDVRGVEAKAVGIGGGTCAAFPRKAGMQSVAWMTEEPLDHQPNEYARINDIVEDAKVLAYLFLRP